MRLLICFSLCLLTSCGEVADGMQSNDAAVGGVILAEAAAEGMPTQNTETADATDKVPPAFRNGDPCSYIPAGAMLRFSPALKYAPNGKHMTRKDATNYVNVHQVNCMYHTQEAVQEAMKNKQFENIQMANISTVISYRAHLEPGLEEWEAKYYDCQQAEGMLEICYHEGGMNVQAFKGNYRLFFDSYVVDEKYKSDEIGREKFVELARAIFPMLPE